MQQRASAKSAKQSYNCVKLSLAQTKKKLVNEHIGILAAGLSGYFVELGIRVLDVFISALLTVNPENFECTQFSYPGLSNLSFA